MNKFAELWADIAECWSESYMQYLTGALKTIELAVAATAIGCIIGLICGIIQTIPCDKNDNIVKRIILGIVKAIVRIYVEVFRGTPMIIQAIFIFYGLPYFFSGKNLDVNFAAYLVVSINTGAYMAETVRGGIMSIDRGQTEGAMSIGMNHFKTMLYVILPQTIRNIIPQIGNNLVINIKDTSVMFVIGYTAQSRCGRKIHFLPVGCYHAYDLPCYDGNLFADFKALGKENGRARKLQYCHNRYACTHKRNILLCEKVQEGG